jgi:tetratricopeptide (TPR) repeat protein
MNTPNATDAQGPALRARLLVPLALLLVVIGLVYLLFGRPGPFDGPPRPAAPTDWQPEYADEVTLWAWRQGMAHYRDGQYEEASTLLGRSAAGLGRYPEPAFYAGVSHLLCERPRVAEDLFDRSLAADDGDACTHYYLARALVDQDRRDDARTHLQRASGDEGRCGRRAERALDALAD